MTREVETGPVWRGKAASWGSPSLAHPCASRGPAPGRRVVLLVVLAVVGVLGWRFGHPAWAAWRSSATTQRTASRLLDRLPAKYASEAELRAALLGATLPPPADDEHERWYICFGERGDEDVRVVRDDGLDRSGRAFVERLVDEGRLGGVDDGALNDMFTYPRGAVWRSVIVDGVRWCVVAGWDESK